MKNIAIFASGAGTNAERIIDYFTCSDHAKIRVLMSNNASAYALVRANNRGVDTIVFDRAQFQDTDTFVALLRSMNIDYIVLAGFLWLLPAALVQAFDGRIINIHPSLLPKYGGKGMYGNKVHRAVIENREPESGITIHKVNEIYDTGDIVAQYKVKVTAEDTPETLAAKIHELEYAHFAETIDNELKNI